MHTESGVNVKDTTGDNRGTVRRECTSKRVKVRRLKGRNPFTQGMVQQAINLYEPCVLYIGRA